jgi:hypothetical protein
MSRDSLVEDYLRWLEPQLKEQSQSPDKTYWDLLNLMFQIPFEPIIDHDDNRAVDGLDLRIDFCHQKRIRTRSLDFLGDCSFLEVLIGLSRRLAFAAGGSAPGWAWQLLDNLELRRLSDPLTRRKASQAEGIIIGVIRRTYQPNGQGGFFPLYHPDEDQTQVEIWYQMSAYVAESHPEY